MRKEIENIFERMVGEDNSPIIIKTEELFKEFQQNLDVPMVAFQNVHLSKITNEEDREILTLYWADMVQRKIFPIFNKTDLCIYRATIFKNYVKEAFHKLRAEGNIEMVENANITIESEIESLKKIEEELLSDKIHIIENTPLIKNVRYYKQICLEKRQSNIDEVTIKETELDKSLFSSTRAAKEFLKIERHLIEDGMLDQNGKWKKRRDKQNPTLLLYLLWKNNYFRLSKWKSSRKEREKICEGTGKTFHPLLHLVERWGIDCEAFKVNYIKPTKFVFIEDSVTENPFSKIDIKPM